MQEDTVKARHAMLSALRDCLMVMQAGADLG